MDPSSRALGSGPTTSTVRSCADLRTSKEKDEDVDLDLSEQHLQYPFNLDSLSLDKLSLFELLGEAGDM